MKREEKIKEIKSRLSAFEYAPTFYEEGKTYAAGDLVVVDDERIYICLFQTAEFPPDSNEWLRKSSAGSLLEAAYLRLALELIEEPTSNNN